MRAYFFNHFFISSIQQGIQAGHAADMITLKYRTDRSKKGKMTREWHAKHLTYILLNGGDTSSLKSILRMLRSPENPYPFSEFKEPMLGNQITSIGIILPERMFSRIEGEKYTKWEEKFLKMKKACKLAI